MPKRKFVAIKLTTKQLVAGLIIIVLAVIGFLAWQSINNLQDKQNEPTTFEQRAEPAMQAMLDDKDYETYQLSQLTFADAALDAKDYSKAQQNLDNITDNVPADKLLQSTYKSLGTLYKATGNKELYKKYTELLIAKLNEQGDKEQVAYYQKELKEVASK